MIGSGGAGTLDTRIYLDAPVATADGQGGVVDGFADGTIECWAGLRWLRGSETVIAARLVGRQPVVVRIRISVAARAVTNEWQMRIKETGQVLAVREVPRLTEDRGHLEFMAEGGLAP